MAINLSSHGLRNISWLYLHDWRETPTVYDWNTVEIQLSKYYSLFYSVKNYRLLESPYPTNCINYETNTEYLSRNECIRKCQINRSISKCNVISDAVNIFKWEQDIRFAVTVDQENCIEELNLNEYCLRMCPNYDCIKYYYKPNLVASGIKGQIENTISIGFSTEAETTYWHKPRIELIEYICYMASIFNLWFGFSILSIYCLLNDLVSILKSKMLKRV